MRLPFGWSLVRTKRLENLNTRFRGKVNVHASSITKAGYAVIDESEKLRRLLDEERMRSAGLLDQLHNVLEY